MIEKEHAVRRAKLPHLHFIQNIRAAGPASCHAVDGRNFASCLKQDITELAGLNFATSLSVAFLSVLAPILWHVGRSVGILGTFSVVARQCSSLVYLIPLVIVARFS